MYISEIDNGLCFQQRVVRLSRVFDRQLSSLMCNGAGVGGGADDTAL